MMILERPLVPVAGTHDGTLIRTVYMHQGYDRLPFNHFDGVVDRYTEPGWYHIFGSLSNPLFIWPTYLCVSMME